MYEWLGGGLILVREKGRRCMGERKWRRLARSRCIQTSGLDKVGTLPNEYGNNNRQPSTLLVEEYNRDAVAGSSFHCDHVSDLILSINWDTIGYAASTQCIPILAFNIATAFQWSQGVEKGNVTIPVMCETCEAQVVTGFQRSTPEHHQD